MAPSLARVSLLSLALASGCTQILGIAEPQPTEPFEGDGGLPDAGTGPDAEACADQVAVTLGTSSFDTDTLADDRMLTCASGAGADVVLEWIAPATDYYVFDTFGSSFDTVLGLVDGCGGAELACNNNVDPLAQSELVRKFTQGQRALVVVDGQAGDKGMGQLEISRVTCPDADLEGQGFPLALSTKGFGDDLAGACGGAGHADRAYHWVAPADGLYQFVVTAPQFAPVISLFDGPRCSDRLLGCNAAASGGNGAHVVRRLRAGQQVSLAVDGQDGDGAIEVLVGQRTTPTCPQHTLTGDMLTVQLGPTRSLAPSCSIAKGAGISGISEHEDATIGFTMGKVGPGCNGGCKVHLESDTPFTAYVLDAGDCSGAEVMCKRPPAQAPFATDLDFSARTDVDQPFTIVVSSEFPDSNPTVTLSVNCFAAC